MKIQPEHYEKLKAGILSLLPPCANERQCWDALHAAGLGDWICHELYPYMNDDHIYSAMRKIVREVQS